MGMRPDGDACAGHLGHHLPGHGQQLVGVRRRDALPGEGLQHALELGCGQGYEERPHRLERVPSLSRAEGLYSRSREAQARHEAREPAGSPGLLEQPGQRKVQPVMGVQPRGADEVRDHEDGGGDSLLPEKGERVLVDVAVAVIESDRGQRPGRRGSGFEVVPQLVQRDEAMEAPDAVELSLQRARADQHRGDGGAAAGAVVDDLVITQDQ